MKGPVAIHILAIAMTFGFAASAVATVPASTRHPVARVYMPDPWVWQAVAGPRSDAGAIALAACKRVGQRMVC